MSQVKGRLGSVKVGAKLMFVETIVVKEKAEVRMPDASGTHVDSIENEAVSCIYVYIFRPDFCQLPMVKFKIVLSSVSSGLKRTYNVSTVNHLAALIRTHVD